MINLRQDKTSLKIIPFILKKFDIHLGGTKIVLKNDLTIDEISATIAVWPVKVAHGL